MHRHNILKLLAIMISGVSAWKASANGFGLPDQDAFATARGEAFAATADNPSAIYYNPSGITQLEGNNLRAGIYGIYFDPGFRPPASAPNSGNTYHVKNNFAAVPQIFYTSTPKKDFPLSFGLGVYAPFGGSMRWPSDTGFRAVTVSGKLTYLTINPVVAWKVLPSLSIAAGPMLNYVDLQTDQGLLANTQPFANYFRFTGNGWSAGANAGVRWQPIQKLSFGTTFRSPAKVTLDGRTEFELQSLRIPASQRPANMGLTFPMSVVGGVSWRPTPKWNLEFDANYTDWSSFDQTTIHQSSAPFPLHADVPVTLDWQASWMYEFGVTRYFDNGWHVSGGYVFNQNSVPNAYYTPLVADMDRHFLSIGTGFKGKRYNFDVAYQFGYGSPHSVTGSTPSSTPGQIAGQSADGKYDFISHAVLVTVGLYF